MNTQQNDAPVQTRLKRLKRARSLYTLSGFALRLCAFFLASGLAAVWIDAHALRHAPWQLRIALLLLWTAAQVFYARREWLRSNIRRMSEDDIAGHVEDAYPSARTHFLGALQLHNRREKMRSLGYDEGLTRLSIQKGFAAFEGVRSGVVWAKERRRALVGLAWACGSAALTALAFALGLAALSDAGRWASAPVEAFSWEFESIEPGNTSAARGEDVNVYVHLTGNAPESPLVEARAVGADGGAGAWLSVPTEPMREERAGSYAAVIRGVADRMEYRARVGDKASETYVIDLLNPPALDRLSASIHFPSYSGLGVKTLEADQGDIAALVGSRVEMRGEASVDLASASLEFQQGEPLPLKIDGRTLSGQFIVEESDRYRIVLKDKQGTENANPPEFIVYAVKDEYPSALDLRPGKDADLDRTMSIQLEAEASDDFGVSLMRLQYTRGETSGSIALGRYEKAEPIVRAAHVWDLSPLDLFPGDVVSYYIEAFDNDAVNGPKRAVSPTRTVRLPSMAEMFNAVSQSSQTQADLLESMRDAQEEANSLVEGVIERSRAEKKLTLQDEKELEKALELQKQVEEDRARLVEEMRETIQEAQKNELLSMEALEKAAELHQLMEQVATEELKEAMRKLRQALEKRPLEERRQQIMAANFDQQKFEERLDQMIRALEKMQLRQELEKARRMAEDLVERQETVVEQTEEAARRDEGGEAESQENRQTTERLAKQERQIGDDSKDLLAQMKKSADGLAEEESTEEIAEEIRRSMREAEERGLSENLSEAQERLEEAKPQEAQRPASEALGELQRMEQDLDNALAYMDGEGGEAVLKALRGALRQTLSLSSDQEALIEQAAEARRIRPYAAEYNGLALDEKTLAEGVGAVAEELQALSSEETQIPLELFWRLQDAKYAAERSSAAFAENELDRAIPIQRETMGRVNAAALAMLKTLNALNAQMQNSGAQSMLDQLQQLAEGQGDVNDLAEQIEQMMREQGQTPSGQQTMERLAFEQSLIREAFEQLEQRMERYGELAERLGGVGDEMENVQSRIESGELNREVLERMRRIETRMLESAKSLEKRHEGENRKGSTASRVFGGQEGAERDDWDKIAETFEGAMREMSEIETPERFRRLIRAYYRALSGSQGGTAEDEAP